MTQASHLLLRIVHTPRKQNRTNETGSKRKAEYDPPVQGAVRLLPFFSSDGRLLPIPLSFRPLMDVCSLFPFADGRLLPIPLSFRPRWTFAPHPL